MADSPDVVERILTWSPVARFVSWGPAARVLGWVRFDPAPPHRLRRWWRLAMASVLSVVLSLAADAALVAIGTRVFPATKGFVHFQFADYAKLTVIGVLIACAAWPVVVRLCAAPRWLFFRLAIVVTLVLFLPDVYIWLQGEPGKAVAVLMAMHVAIALVTYNLLVHLAPVRPLGRPAPAHTAPAAQAAHAAPAARAAQPRSGAHVLPPARSAPPAPSRSPR